MHLRPTGVMPAVPPFMTFRVVITVGRKHRVIIRSVFCSVAIIAFISISVNSIAGDMIMLFVMRTDRMLFQEFLVVAEFTCLNQARPTIVNFVQRQCVDRKMVLRMSEIGIPASHCRDDFRGKVPTVNMSNRIHINTDGGGIHFDASTDKAGKLATITNSNRYTSICISRLDKDWNINFCTSHFQANRFPLSDTEQLRCC